MEERTTPPRDLGKHAAAGRNLATSTTLRYLVMYEGNDEDVEGWSAYVPDLPGYVAAGASRKETSDLIGEAIAAHLELMSEDGDPIPQPTDT